MCVGLRPTLHRIVHKKMSSDLREAQSAAGTGTFGRVRLVRCRLTGRYLALKALKKAKLLGMRQERHVHKEKQILASLQHPFIVRMCVLPLRHRGA